MNKPITLIALFLIVGFLSGQSQISNDQIADIISACKADQRGPYKDIKWFCKDGRILPPSEKCNEPGSIQRARYKSEIAELHDRHKLYLGQILSGTDQEVFFDEKNNNSRMKQYIIEKYLYGIDNGWILQKGKFYRGAIQAEDEEFWGREFLLWILDNERFSAEYYFLFRELAKYIPHGEGSNLIQDIRALSLNIADKNASFMNLRTKIHGNPQERDIKDVIAYQDSYSTRLGSVDREMLAELIDKMQRYYQEPLSAQLTPNIKRLSSNSKERTDANYFSERAEKMTDAEEYFIRASELLESIKNRIHQKISAKERLALMDISIAVEQKALAKAAEWQNKDISSLLLKSCYLGQMANATGYIFDWEFDELLSVYSNISEKSVSFEYLMEFYRSTQRNINWGSALIVTEFGSDMDRYSAFEPLAVSFMDDRIRSSALLYLGQQASQLNDLLVAKAGWKNEYFNKTTSSIQGINPGYAKGRLIVLDQLPDSHVDPKAIYVFRQSPADLEPVAGILSISEGNFVSHLQLLARNLGIPNANITEEVFNDLKKYQGQEIFYAVSGQGGVVLKSAEKITDEELNLFKKTEINEDVITVPTDQMDLKSSRVFALNEVDAASSGILCGPKAANFARLKRIFPDQLVDGLVVPFAVFKSHMMQTVPGDSKTYWDVLTAIFDEQEKMKKEGASSEEIESAALSGLSELSALIKEIPLKPEFITQLESGFESQFGKKLGQVPVFLRSDTNMEDLKDFTGAGLNLTIFNSIEREKILQGIKNVWASPYSDRSYKWRQKYLNNPEDVYPSILIIPSVFVDYSGVIITKDFLEGKPHRLNVAFSQGAGGAVDGQKSESWILGPFRQNTLVTPARDRTFKFLSRNGGTENGKALLSKRLLKDDNTIEIWKICNKIYREMPKAGMQFPYDIELGFQDEKLWIFQIRPFVENKKANSSLYLEKLNPLIPKNLNIPLDEKITI